MIDKHDKTEINMIRPYLILKNECWTYIFDNALHNLGMNKLFYETCYLPVWR